MTSLTCSGVYVAGRPGRGASCNQASPRRLKCFSQARTVAWQRRNSWAMVAAHCPWWASQIMRAHSTMRAGSIRECASRWIVSTSSAVMGRTRKVMGNLLWQRSQLYKRFSGCTTKNSDFKYLIVRYEDLWRDVKGSLHRIFDFLGLDVATYDFSAATNLAVRGSSTVRRHWEEKVHWRPVEKTTDFDPTLRWNHWGRALHERFNWIAGEYLGQFGYEAKEYKTNRSFWTIWNIVFDRIWLIRSSLQSISRTLRSSLKWYLGEERVVKVRRILSTVRSRGRNPSKTMGSSS
jgi:hypothetical protein